MLETDNISRGKVFPVPMTNDIQTANIVSPHNQNCRHGKTLSLPQNYDLTALSIGSTFLQTNDNDTDSIISNKISFDQETEPLNIAQFDDMLGKIQNYNDYSVAELDFDKELMDYVHNNELSDDDDDLSAVDLTPV